MFDKVWADPFATYSIDFPSVALPKNITNFGDDTFQRVSFDYYTDGGELVIKANLPIKEESDVDVTIDEQGVTIKSVQEDNKSVTDLGHNIEEQRSQQFYRYVALPDNADIKKVKQTFKDGKLEIRIPVESEGDAE